MVPPALQAAVLPRRVPPGLQRAGRAPVDTDGKGVERIDETGVWVGGVHYELDCLIFASGFEVGTDYSRRSGFETVGRDGETLSDHWADGMQTMHGMHVHGFPNLFIVGLNQARNLISNVTHNLTEAGTTIAPSSPTPSRSAPTRSRSPRRPSRPGWQLLEGRTASFLGEPRMHARLLQQRGPTRWADVNDGNFSGYPLGPVAYFEFIASWRNSGTFDGLEFRIAADST